MQSLYPNPPPQTPPPYYQQQPPVALKLIQPNEVIQTPDGKILKLASFWRRLASYLIDGLVVGVVFGLFLGVLFLISSQTVTDVLGIDFENLDTLQEQSEEESGRTLSYYIFSAIWIFVVFIYYFLTYLKYGGHLGKIMLKIKIVQLSGNKMTMQNILIRILVLYLVASLLTIIHPLLNSIASLFVLLSCLAVLWDSKRQGWHDKVAKTIVIEKDKEVFVDNNGNLVTRV